MLELEQIELFFPEHLRHFKRNMLREYLQYKILNTIFSSTYGRKLVFIGGTAIHIVHGLSRFSEDLDFDNRGLTRVEFIALTKSVAKKLAAEGYTVEVNNSFKGAFSADIKILNVLFETGLSGHKDEKILIKLDVQPQKFAYTPEGVIINKFDVFLRINVVPADILLAQKFFAILAHKRVMGRDFYDAIFLASRVKPSFEYLRVKSGIKNNAELKSALLKYCEKLNFKLLAKDVEQFLFLSADAKKVLLFPEYLRGL